VPRYTVRDHYLIHIIDVKIHSQGPCIQATKALSEWMALRGRLYRQFVRHQTHCNFKLVDTHAFSNEAVELSVTLFILTNSPPHYGFSIARRCSITCSVE
jgi:hypothetical protein